MERDHWQWKPYSESKQTFSGTCLFNTVYGFRHSSWWGLCVWCLYTHSSPWKGNESQLRSSGEDKGIDLYLQSMVRATAESLVRSLLTIDGVCKMDTTTLCSCIFCSWSVYTCTRWLEELKTYLKIKIKKLPDGVEIVVRVCHRSLLAIDGVPRWCIDPESLAN